MSTARREPLVGLRVWPLLGTGAASIGRAEGRYGFDPHRMVRSMGANEVTLATNVDVQYPLDGILVVDLSDGIPGAYCAKQLADGGAEVVRLEPPEGAAIRRWSPTTELRSGETGPLFQFLGCSTKSVTMDGSADDVAVAERLLAAADIVIWSPTGVFGTAGTLSARTIHERFPAAVVAAITPFGLEGPWADRAASDLTIQAWRGASTRGTQDRPPVQWGGRVVEWLGGIYAAVGVLTARRRQALTGSGDLVDVSLLEVTEFCAGMYGVTTRTMRTPEQNTKLGQTENRSVRVPMIERTSDGWVGVMVATATMWESFCVMVEHAEWLDDPSLYTYAGRVARRHELDPAIRAWTESHTTDDVLEAAALLRIPSAPIGNGAELPEYDHFVERGAYVPNPATGWLQPDVCYRFSGTAASRPFHVPPTIGQHDTEERSSGRPRKVVDLPVAVPELPLAGMRVADFTGYWAGSVVAHYLAMMGADVIHIESAKHPDAIRGHSVKATSEEQWWEWTPLFHGTNTNKRDVTIDMSNETGRSLARRLISQCDVMIENSSPRVMEQWGLDWESVRAIRPDILFVRMPAFGLDGPWRDRTAYAQTIEQVSGLAWVTGYPDGPPTVLDGTCDPLAGAHATTALLIALEHRARTGEGMQVEVAMYSGALNITAEQVLEYQAHGTLVQRQGNRGTGIPQNLYLTADIDEFGRQDTWVAISVDTDIQWAALREALGDPGWAPDSALVTSAGRCDAYDLIDKHLASWCVQRPADDIVSTLWPRGIPVGRVTPTVDADRLEQHRALDFFESVAHPLTGEQLHMRYPVRLEHGPHRLHRTPAPMIGQHNDAVFREIVGCTTEELRELERSGVIGTELLGEHRTR